MKKSQKYVYIASYVTASEAVSRILNAIFFVLPDLL